MACMVCNDSARIKVVELQILVVGLKVGLRVDLKVGLVDGNSSI